MEQDGIRPGSNGVTWKWLVGILAGLLTLGGAGWMTNIQGQVSDSQKNQATQAADMAVVKEKLRVIEDGQKEQRESVKELNKKLDDLKDLIEKKDRR